MSRINNCRNGAYLTAEVTHEWHKWPLQFICLFFCCCCSCLSCDTQMSFISSSFWSDERYSLLRSGELHIRQVLRNDSYSSYRCVTRNLLTGEEKTSDPAHLIVVGNVWQWYAYLSIGQFKFHNVIKCSFSTVPLIFLLLKFMPIKLLLLLLLLFIVTKNMGMNIF